MRLYKKYAKWFLKTLTYYTCNSIASKMCYAPKYAILRWKNKRGLNLMFLLRNADCMSNANLYNLVDKTFILY